MILSDNEILKRMLSPETESSRLEITRTYEFECDNNEQSIPIETLDTINQYDFRQYLQPASIDLRLSHDIKIPKLKPYQVCVRAGDRLDYDCIDLRNTHNNEFRMEPNEFILASTNEKVRIPNDLVAVVDGKSSLARIGLLVHITAGYIDPGFCGNITLELKNLASYPIILKLNMKICQIRFHILSGECIRPYGTTGLGSKYQNSEGTVGSK